MSIADHFSGMNDPRLKPRMLQSLIRDHLPDDRRPFPSSSELASVLSHVKTHGLLSERDPNPDPNPKIAEAWRSTVDEWVDRLLSLVSSNMPDKCWAGICLLGVTFESCTSHRFLASYSLWFQKLLNNMQPTSSANFVKVASCASLADLLTRLANFPTIKKDATSLVGKLIQPIINLLNEDDAKAVWEGAVDLLCTAITLFPSSVHRHYDNVETVLVSKMILARSNSDMSKKCAYCLSLLPRVRGDEDSWSLLMQKILISISTLLNNAFQGLEEEAKSSEIMRLLIPPGKDPPPPLGGQLMSEAFEQATKMLPGMIIPRVSTLMHCCSMMLSNPYPVLVTIPIQTLLALIGRVLHLDGSLQGSLLLFTTAMHQELLCAELPSLHLDCLDLLVAVIKGVRSQLLPHAANIVRLLTEYFRKAKLPPIRIKVYFIMQTLLISFGVGMSLYLAQEVVGNAFMDLTNAEEVGALSSGNSSSKPIPVSHRKRKHDSGSLIEQPNGVNVETGALDRKMPSPLSLKIAALKALEALLTVGGSLKSESWRSSVDSLIINVAINACDGWASEGKYPSLKDESFVSWADFQLAGLEALLASLLSSAHVRPPYLSQGLEIFRRGKQETGTKLAAFCAHALLALEILIHPRALPLVDAPVAKSSALDERANPEHLNPNISSLGLGNFNNLADDDDDDDNIYNSWLGDEPAIGSNNATQQTENQEDILRGSEALAEKNAGDIQEKMQIADAEMASTGREANIDAHQEPALVSMSESRKQDEQFASSSSQGNDLDSRQNIIPGSSSGYKMEPIKNIVVSSNDLNLDQGTSNNSLESLGISLKDRDLTSCDSDSTSINSLPDIVDADPDSDDY
ncbi:proline-, glutamic acid- and leucine-rich protein 1 isoform X2 [Asparagus officinalis]|uniref:proline-, glutamic acid- and leucine-rich protein 1 isoform X2 n=1 Tax=Asparagus officinalis TaxID=4686 RepID=UPI00098DFAD3|nr:proline-, glutamic acid- and leucine-rich protein 1 isoform X2 [Asparagus officinalis]